MAIQRYSESVIAPLSCYQAKLPKQTQAGQTAVLPKIVNNLTILYNPQRNIRSITAQLFEKAGKYFRQIKPISSAFV